MTPASHHERGYQPPRNLGGLIKATQRMQRAVASPNPRLSVPMTVSTIARGGYLHAAMRTWCLMIGELGAVRLPGGALLNDEHLLPRIVDHDCNCGNPAGHQHDVWLADVRDTAAAARDREGEALFDAFTRAVYGEPMRSIDQITSYVASLAVSGQYAFRESGERADVSALLHLLAAEANTGELLSVCGPAYRLTSAVMGTIDMGAAMARNIIEPELDTVAALESTGRMRLVLLLGGALGQLIDDEPDQEYELVPHASSDKTWRPDQLAAAQMGLRVAAACRTRDRDVIMRACTQLPDSPQPVYGLANLLAVRVRQLWGP